MDALWRWATDEAPHIEAPNFIRFLINPNDQEIQNHV